MHPTTINASRLADRPDLLLRISMMLYLAVVVFSEITGSYYDSINFASPREAVLSLANASIPAVLLACTFSRVRCSGAYVYARRKMAELQDWLLRVSSRETPVYVVAAFIAAIWAASYALFLGALITISLWQPQPAIDIITASLLVSCKAVFLMFALRIIKHGTAKR